MADQRQDIDILINLLGEEEARRRLNQLGDQANRTERQTRNLTDGIGDLGDRLGNLGGPLGSVGGQLSQLSQMMGSLAGVGALGAVALAGVAAAAALEGLSVQMSLAADDASEMADKMGVSVARLEELKVLADENSGSVEGYVKTLDKLARSMSKLDDDNAKTTLAFAKLGVAMDDIKNQSPEEQALTLVTAWEDLGRSADATAGIVTILGGGFRELIPMIKGVGNDAGATAERLHHFGVAIDDELIQKGGDAETAFGNLGHAWTGLKQELSKGPTSPFVQFMNWVNEAINGIRKASAEARRAAGQLDDRYNATDEQRKKYAGDGSTTDRVKGGWQRELDMFKKDIKERGVFDTFFKPRKNSETDYRPNKGGSFASDTQWNQPFKGGGVGGKGSKSAEQLSAEANVKTAKDAIDLEDKRGKAAKKHAGEADSAGKKAIADKQRLSELGQQAVLDGERQLITAQKMSNEETAVFETTKGRLRDISQGEKDRVIELAKQRDLKLQQADLDKEAVQRVKEIASVAANAAARLDGIGAKAIADNSFQRRSVGLGAIDRDALRNQDSIAAEAARGRSEIENKFGGKTDVDSIKARADGLALLNERERENTRVLGEETEKRKEFQADWTNGFKNAYASYVDEASNLSGQLEQVGKNLFKGMEDALMTFVTTGKLNFKSFAASIIADLAKIAAKKAASGILGNLFGAAGGAGGFGDLFSWAGPGIFAKGGAFSGGTQFFADGGVVNRSTGFGMSGGKTGVMGEAGPEAIMPLKRGANGQLGVTMSGKPGGGASYTQVNNITIESNGGGEASDRQTANMVSALIEKKWDEKFARAYLPGGQANQTKLTF